MGLANEGKQSRVAHCPMPYSEDVNRLSRFIDAISNQIGPDGHGSDIAPFNYSGPGYIVTMWENLQSIDVIKDFADHRWCVLGRLRLDRAEDALQVFQCAWSYPNVINVRHGGGLFGKVLLSKCG